MQKANSEKTKKTSQSWIDRYASTKQSTFNGRYKIVNSFKKTRVFPKIKNIRSASLENKFGRLEVHLDKHILMQEKISIYTTNSFGCVQIFVPKSWHISMRCSTFLGRCTEHHKPEESQGCQVKFVCTTSFGKIDIFYV